MSKYTFIVQGTYVTFVARSEESAREIIKRTLRKAHVGIYLVSKV